MTNTLIYTALGVAIIIVLALSIVAGYYLQRLRQVKKYQRAQLAELEAQSKAQRERVNTSIQVIASAVGRRDELSLTEASLRISVLLDSLGVDAAVREEYSAFYQLRDAAAHIPILDEWQRLPSAERRKLTKERVKLEQTYGDFVMAAAERIVGKSF
jgi:hypothetical protein